MKLIYRIGIATIGASAVLGCVDLDERDLAEMEATLTTGPTTAQVNEYLRIHGYSGSSFPASSAPNGCGAAGGVPVPDRVYTSACNAHDNCYATLSSYSGKSKSTCDSEFLSAMKSACSSSYPDQYLDWIPRHECYKQAELYHVAVVNLGSDAWNSAQRTASSYMTAYNQFKSNWGVANWTAWRDRDDPSGSGDGEWLNAHQAEGTACATPLAYQCRVKSGTSTGNKLYSSLKDGCHCENSQGTPCADYEIRFVCK